MQQTIFLLLLVLLLTILVSSQKATLERGKDCLPEFCPGPDCPPRDECQYHIDLNGEPKYLSHTTNCSRFWLCEPDNFNGINICLFECAQCAPWPEVTDECPFHAFFFDWTINYPLDPVCNWPALADCTNNFCPLPCQMPDWNGDCHPECCVDADCHGDRPLCDQNTNNCIPSCRQDEDCLGDKPLCDQNTHTCVSGCRLDEDCDNWNGICPTCQWCNKSDNADTGKCEYGCSMDVQCSGNWVCQDHQCIPSRCQYPCCKQHSDCYGYDTLCEVPPWNMDPSCEYCNNNGHYEGICTPGCINTHVMGDDKCPEGYSCNENHECVPWMFIKKILVTTKECQGCSSDKNNEGGAVIKVIGSTQCQEDDPPCVCYTNGLDHPGTIDYTDGNTVTFISGVQEDLPTMGDCHQAMVRTSKVQISWSGPDGSLWFPEVVIIEDNEGYQRICRPPLSTTLTNKDAPVEVTCTEAP